MLGSSHALRAAVALCLLAAGSPAEPQEFTAPCAERARVVERLAERFGETRKSMGLNQVNGLVEVFASDDTGSWTILLTRPDGTSCLLASGELWEPDARPLVKPGNPA